jgi:hypothetical protein
MSESSVLSRGASAPRAAGVDPGLKGGPRLVAPSNSSEAEGPDPYRPLTRAYVTTISSSCEASAPTSIDNTTVADNLSDVKLGLYSLYALLGKGSHAICVTSYTRTVSLLNDDLNIPSLSCAPLTHP